MIKLLKLLATTKRIMTKPSLLIKLVMDKGLGCFLQTLKMIELLKDNLVIMIQVDIFKISAQ